MPPALQSARRNYQQSALIATRAVQQARAARSSGAGAVASVVAVHQLANAQTSQVGVIDMLAEQNIRVVADAVLNLATYVTEGDVLAQMLVQIETDAKQFEDRAQAYVDKAFDRLVASIVQDAGRAAESVAVASRPRIGHVRFVSLPCCSRCAILSGRVYRWSTGFERHPGCDCTMIPTTLANDQYAHDPNELVRSGQVRGLSKADQRALAGGADLGRVVNIRSKSTGLLEAGQSITRGGRPTPAGIYRQAGNDRARALTLLQAHGYII